MMFEDVFLSSRQITGLRWLREGWPISKIADQQKISPKTVNNYLAEARLRLDVLWKDTMISDNTLLSSKQIECLQLLKEGLTVPEIAEKLDLGHETIKSHLAKARKRLGAKNSTEALVKAIKLGIIKL